MLIKHATNTRQMLADVHKWTIKFALCRNWIAPYSTLYIPDLFRILIHDTVRNCTCTALKWTVLCLCIRFVTFVHNWYWSVPFPVSNFIVYKRTAPIRYFLHRYTVSGIVITVKGSIGMLCKTVAFGTVTKACTRNSVQRRHQFSRGQQYRNVYWVIYACVQRKCFICH